MASTSCSSWAISTDSVDDNSIWSKEVLLDFDSTTEATRERCSTDGVDIDDEQSSNKCANKIGTEASIFFDFLH